MKNKPFRFKQFDIYQDQTAMKVGTDGVLLGAWANLESGNHVLDVGTGTGLISLMLAQRFENAIVNAVEIDLEAYNQAQDNFKQSKFSSRISLNHTSFQEYHSTIKFDLIVSNPPFFISNNRVEHDARKIARQQETLTFSNLLSCTSNLLNKKGLACFIIPFELESNFLDTAKENNLYPRKILHVKGNKETLVKRSLIELSFDQDISVQKNQLIIEMERHQYTEDYINLTKAFYLKM